MPNFGYRAHDLAIRYFPYNGFQRPTKSPCIMFQYPFHKCRHAIKVSYISSQALVLIHIQYRVAAGVQLFRLFIFWLPGATISFISPVFSFFYFYSPTVCAFVNHICDKEILQWNVYTGTRTSTSIHQTQYSINKALMHIPCGLLRA